MARFYFIIAVTYVAADKWQLTYYGVKISHLKGGVLAHCLGDQHSALAMLQSPLRALYLFTKSKLILCKFAEVSALTHYDRWPSGKPGFDFPTDGSPTDREEWSPAPSVLAQ